MLSLENKNFGEWEVVSFSHINKHRKSVWVCRCSCGTEKLIVGSNLLSGKSTKCRTCGNKGNNITHNMSTTPLYKQWAGMKDRCTNPNRSHWKYYGGRGITLCPEWFEFENFMSWALSNGYQEGLQIHRKDNDIGYEPSNCIFLTPSQHTILHNIGGK